MPQQIIPRCDFSLLPPSLQEFQSLLEEVSYRNEKIEVSYTFCLPTLTAFQQEALKGFLASLRAYLNEGSLLLPPSSDWREELAYAVAGTDLVTFLSWNDEMNRLDIRTIQPKGIPHVPVRQELLVQSTGEGQA